MHARKFAAAIQEASGSGHPTLLRVERNAGHGGADLVRQTVAMYADTYAFLMHTLGLEAK
jgi:prolyl oligopeptidase